VVCIGRDGCIFMCCRGHSLNFSVAGFPLDASDLGVGDVRFGNGVEINCTGSEQSLRECELSPATPDQAGAAAVAVQCIGKWLCPLLMGCG
jgi:hypothetical protein